jgi:hypothetical protein
MMLTKKRKGRETMQKFLRTDGLLASLVVVMLLAACVIEECNAGIEDEIRDYYEVTRTLLNKQSHDMTNYNATNTTGRTIREKCRRCGQSEPWDEQWGDYGPLEGSCKTISPELTEKLNMAAEGLSPSAKSVLGFSRINNWSTLEQWERDYQELCRRAYAYDENKTRN